VKENVKEHDFLFENQNEALMDLDFSESGDFLFVINRDFFNTSMKTYATSTYNLINEFNYNVKFPSFGSPQEIESTFLNNINYIISGNSLGLIKFKLDNIISVSSLEQLPIVSISPNPNNSITTINLNTSEAEKVDIIILNQSGKEIESILSGLLEPGKYNYTWNGSQYPSGVYYCRITGKNINETLKIILEK
jgi:hypothetical protein